MTIKTAIGALVDAKVRPFTIVFGAVAVLGLIDGGSGYFFSLGTLFSVMQLFATLGLVALGLGLSMLVRHPSVEAAHLVGFNFVGGTTLSPEFAALLSALVLHHAAHISEVVRGAILSVPRGQRDAARALGLSRFQTLRMVTIPLALRAMVPLLATSCVSLIKNSSLAVAIGFPDVVSILNTTGNQTGHNIETMCIMIVVYLSLSLAVAAALNRYNTSLLALEAQLP